MQDVYALYEVWYDSINKFKFQTKLVAIFETYGKIIDYIKRDLEYKKIGAPLNLDTELSNLNLDNIIHFTNDDNNISVNYTIKNVSYYFDEDI